MERNKDYFTLNQAAHLVQPEHDGQPLPQYESVKELLDKVFSIKDVEHFHQYLRGDVSLNTFQVNSTNKKKLIPSCFLQSASLSFAAEVLTDDEKVNGEWPVVKEIDSTTVPSLVIVDLHLDDLSRNSGTSSGRIQLKSDGLMPLELILQDKAKWRYIILTCELPEFPGQSISCKCLAPTEVAESELFFRRQRLLDCYGDDPGFVKRLEEFEAELSDTPKKESADKTKAARQLVVAGRRVRKKNDEIALEIDATYPGFSDAELGRLLAYQEHEEYEARRKRGRRARGKAK